MLKSEASNSIRLLDVCAMYALIDFAQSIQVKELWVCTGAADNIAVSFYKSLGFELLGCAAEWAPGRTMDDSDVVLKRML